MKKILILIMVFSFCLTLYAEEKPIISVLDFYTEEGISRSEMRLFISLLSSALFQTKIYTVIDVSERETLLAELEFSVSGCTDESCQLEIGRLLAAEAIIIGRIGRLGTRYVLSIKMLETDTGRAINTADGVYDSIDKMVDEVGVIADKLASVHREEIEKEVVREDDVIAEIDETDTVETIEETETDKVTDDIPLDPLPSRSKDKFISFSIGIQGGPKFPIAEVGDLFHIGMTPLILVNLDLNLSFGKLGFGIVTGVDFEGIKKDHPDVYSPYELVIIPAGGNVRFESGFLLPFFVLLELMGGITYGMVNYGSDKDSDEFIRPFSGVTAGIGFAFTKNIRFALCLSYMVLLFEYDPLQGIAPLARFEIHF